MCYVICLFIKNLYRVISGKWILKVNDLLLILNCKYVYKDRYSIFNDIFKINKFFYEKIKILLSTVFSGNKIEENNRALEHI